jgi:hypothetical protein
MRNQQSEGITVAKLVAAEVMKNMETNEKEYQDISMTVGQMVWGTPKPPAVQCFSFDRVSRLVFTGIYRAAIDAGFSHEKALALLTHTRIRHMLDDCEDGLEDLGREMFDRYDLRSAPNLD